MVIDDFKFLQQHLESKKENSLLLGVKEHQKTKPEQNICLVATFSWMY